MKTENQEAKSLVYAVAPFFILSSIGAIILFGKIVFPLLIFYLLFHFNTMYLMHRPFFYIFSRNSFLFPTWSLQLLFSALSSFFLLSLSFLLSAFFFFLVPYLLKLPELDFPIIYPLICSSVASICFNIILLKILKLLFNSEKTIHKEGDVA